ncbi:hypothetical protein TEQG_03411 [Trichophyton equinum CBS 127.97]|uniref:Uncharacterized protein n=1 Tax=Trichophyton equinum (strain ATCC MYA-4606 / CBS 127.97) TaxID=559882 RepID=F2PRM2_TRIEC|nr:hypothetical protein TEQG_03411 [Trichophyton equinum CBS 127.97]
MSSQYGLNPKRGELWEVEGSHDAAPTLWNSFNFNFNFNFNCNNDNNIVVIVIAIVITRTTTGTSLIISPTDWTNWLSIDLYPKPVMLAFLFLSYASRQRSTPR